VYVYETCNNRACNLLFGSAFTASTTVVGQQQSSATCNKSASLVPRTRKSTFGTMA